MSIHAFQFFPNRLDLICSFKTRISLLSPASLALCSCHAATAIMFSDSSSSLWLHSVTIIVEPSQGSVICHISSGYFSPLHVNGSDRDVDSESQSNFMGNDATTKPAFLLSADPACATLPNPLFVFNSFWICPRRRASVWYLIISPKLHPWNMDKDWWECWCSGFGISLWTFWT